MIKIKTIVKPLSFDYTTNKEIIEELISEYPFLKAKIVGRTVLGRGIFSLSLGSKNSSALLVGGFKGTDALSPMLLYMFIEDLCKCVKYGNNLCGVNMKRALSQLGVTVIPSLNPDSREINLYGAKKGKTLRCFLESKSKNLSLWEANAMGVDIGENFGADFESRKERAHEKGITAPSEKGFCGAYPESEKETKALTCLCRLRHFRQLMVLSGSGEALIAEGATEEFPERELMTKILAQSCGYYKKEKGGVSALKWFSEEFKRPAFQLMAGEKGEEEEIYEKVKEALTVFSLM